MKKYATIAWVAGILIVIFGCLGAIAAPKSGLFVNKCRSSQSEAKINLSGLFRAEKTFWHEYEFYTSDLVAIDWYPDGSPQYVYGFVEASARASDERVPGLDPTRRTTLDSRVVGDKRYSLARTKTVGGREFSEDDFKRLVPAAFATSNGFLAFAIGDPDSDGKHERFDVWTIDNEKHLESVSNDCLD